MTMNKILPWISRLLLLIWVRCVTCRCKNSVTTYKQPALLLTFNSIHNHCTNGDTMQYSQDEKRFNQMQLRCCIAAHCCKLQMTDRAVLENIKWLMLWSWRFDQDWWPSEDFKTVRCANLWQIFENSSQRPKTLYRILDIFWLLLWHYISIELGTINN